MFIGIDLGGTKIAAGIVDPKGELLASRIIATQKEKGAVQIIEDIISICRQLTDCLGISIQDIKAIGVGVPGPVDDRKGEIINCVNLAWKNTPFQNVIERSLHIPTFAGNDATLAGIAELENGALAGVQTGALLTIGTGIGGAVIINGKIQNGAHQIGSEFGHMIVGDNFYDCSCGRNGCLETFSSANAIIRYTKKLIEEGRKSEVLQFLTGGNMNNLNGRIILDAAKSGDLIALEAVDRAVKYLAVGLINIISVIDPDIIAIGGGLSKAGSFLFEKIRTAAVAIRYFKEIPIGKVVPAKHGNEAGVMGAAMLAKQKYGNRSV